MQLTGEEVWMISENTFIKNVLEKHLFQCEGSPLSLIYKRGSVSILFQLEHEDREEGFLSQLLNK